MLSKISLVLKECFVSGFFVTMDVDGQVAADEEASRHFPSRIEVKLMDSERSKKKIKHILKVFGKNECDFADQKSMTANWGVG